MSVLDSVSGTALNVKSLKDEAVKREELEILNWIIPISYGPQQTDSFRRHQPGTGQWFLDSSQYHDWLDNKGRVLFCPGIPGAGKTILSSIVVDDVNKRFRQDEKVGIAYIYCKFGQQTEQTKENLVASLLKQLAGGLPDLPQSVKDLYSRHQRSQTLPVLNELSMALRSVAAIYSRTYILIDALDEIKASNGCRSMFLSVVFSLKMQNANIFATSRPIPEILENFKEATSMQIYARTNDIQHYLEAQMFRFPEFVTTSEQVQEEVKTAIIESVDGMYVNILQLAKYS